MANNAFAQPNYPGVGDLTAYGPKTTRPKPWSQGGWLRNAFPNYAAGRGFHPFARNGVDIFGRYIGDPAQRPSADNGIDPRSDWPDLFPPQRVPGVVDPRAALVKPERGLGVSPHGETPARERMRQLLAQTSGMAGNAIPGPELFRGLDRMGFLDLLRGENAAAPARLQSQINAWNRQEAGPNVPAGQGMYIGSNNGVRQFAPAGYGGSPMPAAPLPNSGIPLGWMSHEEAVRLGYANAAGALGAFYRGGGMPQGYVPGGPQPLPWSDPSRNRGRRLPGT